MYNHDDKYPSRPGFEPGTPRLQAPVDTSEPSGPAIHNKMNRCPATPNIIILSKADRKLNKMSVKWIT